RLPPARRAAPHGRRLRGVRRRIAQRHLPQPRAHREGAALRRRRAADRQVQARLLPGQRAGVTTMSERSHLSIGEVLNLLQEEFPDVTISKIRFLESQGLLDPERTPSGYRKFYDADIERLRWILRQQRENFLPLKVIKDRLAAGELDEPQPANGVRAATASDAPAERDAPDAGTDAEPARAARRA